MADKMVLPKATYDEVVRVAKELKGSRSAVHERFPSISMASLGKIMCASGLTKSAPTIVERDRAVVSTWMERAGDKLPGMPVKKAAAPREPAAKKATTRKPAAKKTAAKK
jgi:hypothetical protein